MSSRPGDSNLELREMPSDRAAASTNGFIDDPGCRPRPSPKVTRLTSLARKSRPAIIARTMPSPSTATIDASGSSSRSSVSVTVS
jgi:hypothetical protein